MFNVFLRNKSLLVILAVAGLMAFLAIGLGIFIVVPDITKLGQKPKPDLSLALNKYPAVTSITPEEFVLLQPGKPQVFRASFRNGGDITTLRASLSQSLIRQPNKVTTLPITTSFDKPTNSVVVTMNSPIQPVSTYALVIKNPASGNPLLAINYHSGDIQPTAVISNNPKLQEFLPHKTDSYSLIYDKNKNIYIFHFKIDPESTLTLSSQYNNAKANATQFITAKGIPINSIAIEWNRY